MGPVIKLPCRDQTRAGVLDCGSVSGPNRADRTGWCYFDSSKGKLDDMVRRIVVRRPTTPTAVGPVIPPPRRDHTRAGMLDCGPVAGPSRAKRTDWCYFDAWKGQGHDTAPKIVLRRPTTPQPWDRFLTRMLGTRYPMVW